MKRQYKILFLLAVFIFISTFNPKEDHKFKESRKNLFTIQNIEIINNELSDTTKIQENLRNLYNKNIFLIRSIDIELPLKEIHFIEKIKVKKKYPNTLIINIFETKPIGIIFKKNKKYIIDSSSNLISEKDFENTKDLYNIFGDEAEKYFISFYERLNNNNFSINNIKNFYFYKIGRWDLELKNKVIIKFPDNKIDEAINKSIELLNRQDFKKYKIIDLRVDGKIITE